LGECLFSQMSIFGNIGKCYKWACSRESTAVLYHAVTCFILW
jgi:hypothetical protein